MKRTSKKNTEKKVQKKEVHRKVRQEQGFVQKNLKYLFLILILTGILIDIYISFSGVDLQDEVLLSQIKKSLTVPAILLGLLSVFFERNKISGVINRLFNTDEANNTHKTGLIDKIKTPFSKKELLTTSLFIIILGISVLTLFYKLGNFDLYSDEISVTRGAAGYYHTGEYKQWDFIKGETVERAYNRAKPHQFIVAQSFKFFGINAWSARFPSAFFGVLLIVFLFFIGKFFIKDKRAVLLSILSLAFYFDFLALGRWARMYAMVFPAFMLAFYWAYKFLTEYNTYKPFNSAKYPVLKNYFNFNYIFLPFLLILLYINLFTHQNSALIFPVFLIFSVFSIFLFYKEKKYITASVLAIGILIFQIINPLKVGFRRFTFFEVDHAEHYSDILFGYPFSANTNIIFLLVGLSVLFFVKNNHFKKKYLILFILSFLTWILFSYVFDYPSHFRYISFATPLIILLILGVYILLSKILYNKFIQIILALLVTASISIHFTDNFNSLYVTNSLSPAKPSVAYNSITDNIRKNDVIFRHWGPKLYLEGIDPDTKFISLGSYKGKAFSEIFEKFKNHKSGWITWHTHHGGRMDKQFLNYSNLYFKKFHGHGVDNTGTEVFYYNQSMLQPIELFEAQQFLPTANLNLNNSYSFAFDLIIDSVSGGSPFTLRNDNVNNIICNVAGNNLIIKPTKNDSVFMQLPLKKKSHIVLYQEVKNNTISYGLYMNGELITEKEIQSQIDLVKFQVNPYFNGNINNIRIYDFVLNPEQINEIIKNQKGNNSQDLFINDEKFTALYLWHKN